MKRIYFLPWNFSFQNLVAKFPLPAGLEEEKVCLILSLVTELQTMNSDTDGELFVGLGYKRMRKYNINDFKPYKEYLIKASVLECNNLYIPGKQSLGYRFTAPYRTKVKIYTSNVVEKSISTAVDAKMFFETQPGFGFLSQWFNYHLQIDKDIAIRMLKKQYQASRKPLKKKVASYNRGLVTVENLRRRKFLFKEDKTSGRLHTSLTNLNKSVRASLSFNRQFLVSVDVKNAQPFFSIALFRDDFYSIERGELLTLGSLFSSDRVYKQCYSNRNKVVNTHSSCNSKNISIDNNSLDTLYRKDIYIDSLINLINIKSRNSSHPLSIMRHERSQLVDCDDVKLYMDLVVKGQFYECFLGLLKRSKDGCYRSLNRADAKRMAIFVIYSSNQTYSQPSAWAKRVFREHFPTVYEVFKILKRGDHTRLAVLLQAIEAEIVLHRAAKRISRERRRLPIFTIHDSIVTTEGNEEYVKSVLEDEIRKAVGVTPPLSIEYWKPLNKVKCNSAENAA